jgi:hypothetical protein
MPRPVFYSDVHAEALRVFLDLQRQLTPAQRLRACVSCHRP